MFENPVQMYFHSENNCVEVLILKCLKSSVQTKPNIIHRVQVGQIFEFDKLILFLKMHLGGGLAPSSQTVGSLLVP
jgi:hypothetical protein